LNLPDDSITVKTRWMVLPKNQCRNLPVWDYKVDRNLVPDLDGFSSIFWPNAVQVCESATAIRIPNIPEVSLARFFSIPLSTFSSTELSLLNAEWEKAQAFKKPGIATPEKADSGGLALAVGFHFTTREMPDWFWATLWWHPSPEQAPFGHDRPARRFQDTRWLNYLLDISVDMDWPEEGNAQPNSVFNPYLELQLRDGNKSNCMTCHARAFWRADSMTCKTPLLDYLPFGGYITWSKHDFLKCPEPRQNDTPNPGFDPATKLFVDFVWSLATPLTP
jgi:hypothetical protein